MPVCDVVLPCLDEAGALPWVLERMPAGYHAIVVDNGSTDGSPELAHSLGATVVHASVRGFGSACFAGLTAATADVVAFLDCDASMDPGELPLVVTPVLEGTAELVLGARQATRGAWPLHARIANNVLARSIRQAGPQVTDLGPMRAASREGLLSLNIADRRSGWPLEMVLRANHAGWRISEVPVSYRPRTGRSKVTGTVRGTFTAISDMRGVLRELGGVRESGSRV